MQIKDYPLTNYLADDDFLLVQTTSDNAFKSIKASTVKAYCGGASSSSTSSTFLLDNVLGVVSARSLRKLKTSYTGKAVKTILSDGTSQDIDFTSSNIIDVAALKSFAGNGNAFVNKIYDQIGGLDISQSTFSSCPKIVSNGLVITAANKPTLSFNNSFLSGSIPCGYPITIIAVVEIFGSTNGAFIKCGNTSSGLGIGVGSGNFDNPGTTLVGLDETVAWLNTSGNFTTNSLAIAEINCDGSNFSMYLNGIQVESGSAGIVPPSQTYSVGGYSSRLPICNISEDIVFNLVISSTTRSAIVQNMKEYYSIS
ncbi:hypothetical protein [Nostoc sp.]|uniref:hypothetical protein n=1 Tax=Nostoc sp. TaxID=1180 RepID=UPI002FFBBCEA